MIDGGDAKANVKRTVAADDANAVKWPQEIHRCKDGRRRCEVVESEVCCRRIVVEVEHVLTAYVAVDVDHLLPVEAGR